MTDETRQKGGATWDNSPEAKALAYPPSQSVIFGGRKALSHEVQRALLRRRAMLEEAEKAKSGAPPEK